MGTIETSVLKCRDMAVVPYKARYTALAERLGVSFDTVLFALDHIPLCLRAPEHGPARRGIARVINSEQGRIEADLPALVRRHFAPLTRAGIVDAHAELVAPLVDEILSELMGISVDLGKDSTISRLFSSNLGPRQRRRMEGELLRLRQDLEGRFPDEGEDRIGQRLAIAILGRDALMGTLSNSLHHVFEHAEGRPLDKVNYPELPPRTGVPYVDRQALTDVELEDRHFAKGDVFRVHLETYERSDDPQDRRMLFGAGAHVCLGRPLSLALWTALMAFLQSQTTRVRVLNYALRKDDVFRMPSELVIEVN